MKWFVVFIALFLVASFSNTIYAADNNKFGIHLAVPANEQLEKSAELVNSQGGDWGYVTLVIQQNDMNKEKWQSVFDKMRELRLIPIIRIATETKEEGWVRPSKDDAQKWAEFLNSLNWVTKERYVILFNETNHGREWGGSVDPVNFAETIKVFAEKIKAKNKDFYLMVGGFDASAPASAPAYADEEEYFRTVVKTIGVESFNSLFSGLSSHSYPNPGFVGSPYGTGRESVRNYEWELSLLKSLGIKELPVFITETGWDGSALSRDTVAQNFKTVYNEVWLPDDRVKAVTPFILDYQGQPFLGFSWRRLNEDSYYPQFDTVKDMKKQKGDPNIIEKGELKYKLPRSLVVNSSYHYKIEIKNKGQAIWDDKYGYKLEIQDFDSGYFFSDISNVKPNQSVEIHVYFKSGILPGKKQSKISLYKGDKEVIQGQIWQYEVFPLPSLDFNVSLYPRLKHKGDDFEVQIFDEDEQLVYKKKNVSVEHTEGEVGQIKNITLEKKYRVVILKPYYLPRQVVTVFNKNTNHVVFERMYPVDFDKDGNFDFNDIWTLITKPGLIGLLLP